MVVFQVFPEQLAQAKGQRPQGRVVQRWLAFEQVVDQDITDGLAGDLVAVDHLLDADLALGLAADSADSRRGSGREHAHRVEQLVEVGAGVDPASDGRQKLDHLQAVPDGDVADHAALGRHDGGDAAQRGVLGMTVGWVCAADSDQLGEPLGVAAAGHLGGQDLHRRGCQ